MNFAKFASSLGACSLLLAAACGDDDPTIINPAGSGGSDSAGSGGSDSGGSDSGGSDSGGSDSGGTGGSMAAGAAGDGGSAGSGSEDLCPDHPAVTEVDGRCEISSSLAEPITEDLTLTSDLTWLMTGPVIVGDDEEETVLTVEAGTTVFGNQESFILIQRSSKIMADGSAAEPIVFTSSAEEGSRQIQDWGGLVINGRAPINVPDGLEGDPGSAPGEADTGRFGGDVDDDDSGVLRYVRIEFAGKDVDPENELNGIAFQGVGSSTVVDFVQVHMAFDDAVEFFGGTVNVKHLVLTGINDDKLDWTDGWTGKAQFVVSEELDESGAQSDDPRGIEADNEEDNNTAEPYSSPIISNVTLIGRDGNDQDGMRLRRGTKGQVWNTIVSGYGPCINVTEDATEANVTNGELVVENLVLNCESAVNAESTGAADLVAAATSIVEDDALLDGWIPGDGSPALGIGAGPADDWFDAVDYAGAFDGTNDWTEGWIETATD